MIRLILIAVLSAALVGCSRVPLLSRFSKDKAPGPEVAELAPLSQARVNVTRRWAGEVGSFERKGVARLVPGVMGGRLYATDMKGRVSAYDAQSGKRLWQSDLDVAVTGATGVGDGLVLVGAADGAVVALDAASGTLRWRRRVTSEVLAPPGAAAGTVVVRTGDGRVLGINAADGVQRWVYQRPVPTLSLRGTGAVLILSGSVYAGFASGKLIASDLATGNVLWESSVAFPRGRNEIDRMVDLDAQPVVRGGKLFAGAYQGRLVALDLGDGAELWSQKVSVQGELALDAAQVYVTTAGDKIMAVDQVTGATTWTQDGLAGRRVSGPVVADGFVVVGDGEGWLHVLDAADGRLVGRGRGGSDRGMQQPVSDGRRIYVLDLAGTLGAFSIDPR